METKAAISGLIGFLVALATLIVFPIITPKIIGLLIPQSRHYRQPGYGIPRSVPCPDGRLGIVYFLNSLRSFRNGTHLQTLHRNFLNVGNTFSFWILGSPVIATCEPENAQTILSSAQGEFESGRRRREALEPIIGKGVFAVDGSDWRHARGLIRPALAKKHIQDFAMMERHFEALLKAISSVGPQVDLQNLFFKLTMDTATEMLTGTSIDSLLANDTDVNEFMCHWENATSYIKFLTFTGPLGRWIPIPRVMKAKKYLLNYLNSLISQRQKHNEKGGRQESEDRGYVFLDALSEQVQDTKFIRDQTLSALAGGRDTTASLLSNLFFVLAHRTDVWLKLRNEASSLLNSKTAAEAVDNAKYARWCLNESLRLYSVVPGIRRSAIKDTSLPTGGGEKGDQPIFIPAGTDVIASQWATHRREDLYGPDADMFVPERWESLDPGWAYFPFGGGQRACLGQHFALNEVTFVLLKMAQSFKSVEALSSEPWREKLSFTVASASGCRVKLQRA